MTGQPADQQGRIMAQFSENLQRLDPYKNFKFRLKWDGKYIAGISKLTVGLKQRPKSSSTEKVATPPPATNHQVETNTPL
jgi:hypothetical protein